MRKLIYTIVLLIGFTTLITAQSEKLSKVSAQIVDSKSQPIIFATVYSKMKKRGTISSQSGHFTMMLSPNDTLELSAISYEKRQILVSKILQGDTIIVMKRKTYVIADVDVMSLRWHDFKHKVMNNTAKEENKKVLQIQGLPNVYQPRVELGPYAGMTNPVSLLLIYYSKANIYKRRKERWMKIYRKYNTGKVDSSMMLQKKQQK